MVLGVLCAGNAYIIATASGNLGRAVLAIPVGIAASFLSALLLKFTLAYIAYAMLLFGWAALCILDRALRRIANGSFSLGILQIVVSIPVMGYLGVILLAPAVDKSILKEPAIVVAASYPFVCACLAGTLVPHTRYKGPVEAFMDSLTASLKGLLAGGITMPVLVPIVDGDIAGALIVGACMLMACNYVFMKNFFSAITRETPPKTSVAEPREAWLDAPENPDE